MTCSSCGTANEAGRKFCLACGARLAVPCPRCGTPNAPIARFCGECGHRLDAEPGSIGQGPVNVGAGQRIAAAGAAGAVGGAAAGPTAGQPVAERRIVSVMFADLVGFTSLADGRDPEETRELLSRYFDVARSIVDRYGGTIEKFIGDAVMAVWGAPLAREDDAERAVRAALDLVDAVRALGPALSARAAVATGEVAVTLGATNQGMVAGDLVNVASRLQSMAVPGTVVVDDTTCRAAEAAIAFEEAGEQALRGKTAPVPAHRALRVVAERAGRNRASGLEAPFVGRAEELRLIKELFHASSRDARTRLISVVGPAGIGKSRLAWEFLKYIDGLVETVYWHDGRSPSYGEGVTFWALGEMVRGRAGLREADDEATTRARVAEMLARWVHDEAERRWIEPALLALLGIGDQPAASEQLFAAWRTFFERIAEEGAVVLVFEDLHWADSGLLDFIAHLVDWARALPITVITLARPELLEHRPDWGAGLRSFVSIELLPLPEAAMRELLGGLVPGLPDAAVQVIVDRAGGIPLYAVETVRMLLGRGDLVTEGGAYRPTTDLADLAVPETLAALISGRLDTLDPGDRRVIQDAAVLGQSFTLAALGAISTADPADLESRLNRLVRKEVLVHNADARSPERGQYAFVQALVREVAYNTLSRAERKSRHLAAARWFEGLGEDELAGALAGHYVAAYRAAAEGPERAALEAQARVSLRAAADRAVALAAPGQAIGYLEQALTLTRDAAEQAGIEMDLAGAAESVSRYELAHVHYERVVERARSSGDADLAARAIAANARVLVSEGRVEPAIDVLRAGIAELEATVDDRARGLLHAQLARAHSLHGESALAITEAELALAAAGRINDVAIVSDALITRTTALTQDNRNIEAAAILEGALELARRASLVATELRARNNLAGILWTVDPARSVEVARVGREVAERYGLSDWGLVLTRISAVQWFALGAWDELVAAIDEAERRSPPLDMRTSFDHLRSWVAAGRGEVGRARECLERARPRIAGFSNQTLAGYQDYSEGLLALLDGRAGEAIVHARAATVAWETSPEAAVLLARAAAVAGSVVDAADAERIVAPEASNGVIGAARVSEVRAIAAGLAGTRADAVRLFAAAVATHRAAGFLAEEALCLVSMTAVLGPDDPLVRETAERVRPQLDRIGAAGFLALLDAAGRRPAPEASRDGSSATSSPTSPATAGGSSD